MTDSLHTPLVLIVDDDMMMRVLARETLEQAGFRVAEADNGQAGLTPFSCCAPTS